MNRSYWDETLLPQEFDVLIVGSGIIGLSSAIHLKRINPNYKIGVLERGLIPAGASTKNAGFACFGSLSEIIEDLSTMGEDAVLGLVRDRWEGLNYLRHLTNNEDIGYVNNGGYELFTAEEHSLFEKCNSQLQSVNELFLRHFGQKVFERADEKSVEFGFRNVSQVIFNPFEGQLHTGKLMRVLLDIVNKMGVLVMSGAEVINWSETANAVEVNLQNWHSLRCEKLIIATNGFARELISNIEVTPTRAQVLITEPIEKLKIAGTFHMDRGFYYFRNIDQRILLGGARQVDIHSEYTTDPNTSETIQQALEKLLRETILPGLNPQIEKRWTGTMGTGPSKLPIVKRVSDRAVVAVRMAGMGIAIGSRIGKKAADLVTG